jgi:hypothetical protein
MCELDVSSYRYLLFCYNAAALASSLIFVPLQMAALSSTFCVTSALCCLSVQTFLFENFEITLHEPVEGRVK